MRSGLRIGLSFGISAVLLALLVRAVDGPSLVAALSSADWRFIVPAIGLYFVGAWLRATRWGQLLPEYAIGTSTLFRVLVIGFTVNNLLPFRMGEVARAYLLARWRGVPYGASAASLIVERILDGLSLAALLLIALLFVPSAPRYIEVVGILAAAVFCAGAALIALAAWRSDAIAALVRRLASRLPARLEGPVVRAADTFSRALVVVHAPARLVRLLVLSILAWCSELSLFFVLMPSLGLPPAYPLAFLVGSTANFATLVPSSPGYVGTFDGTLIKVLSDTAGMATAQAAAYAIVVHATLFLPVVILGTLLLWRSHMSFQQITHTSDRTSANAAGGDLQAAA